MGVRKARKPRRASSRLPAARRFARRNTAIGTRITPGAKGVALLLTNPLAPLWYANVLTSETKATEAKYPLVAISDYLVRDLDGGDADSAFNLFPDMSVELRTVLSLGTTADKQQASLQLPDPVIPDFTVWAETLRHNTDKTIYEQLRMAALYVGQTQEVDALRVDGALPSFGLLATPIHLGGTAPLRTPQENMLRLADSVRAAEYERAFPLVMASRNETLACYWTVFGQIGDPAGASIEMYDPTLSFATAVGILTTLLRHDFVSVRQGLFSVDQDRVLYFVHEVDAPGAVLFKSAEFLNFLRVHTVVIEAEGYHVTLRLRGVRPTALFHQQLLLT